MTHRIMAISLSCLLSLSFSASYIVPPCFLLPPLSHLNSTPLWSPFLPSRKLIHFDDFLITFLPPRPSLHPLPHPSSALQVYINHTGLARHKKGSPFFVPQTCHEVCRQARGNITWGWKQSQYRIWRGDRAVLPYRSLHMNISMNLSYLQHGLLTSWSTVPWSRHISDVHC